MDVILDDRASFTLTGSVGVTAIPAGEMSIEAPLGRADRALYRARRHGRNRVEAEDFATNDMFSSSSLVSACA
jgi:PleD family two-component response regulator